MAKHRVCVIGNSHAAALRVGLDLLPELNDRFVFDFFAAQSDLMRSMQLVGRKLMPTSEVTRQRLGAYSQGRTEIVIDGYESFLIVGMGFGIAGPGFVRPFSALQKYQFFGFQNTEASSGGFISRPCFNALTESVLRNSTANYFAEMLKKEIGVPVYLSPAPYPSEDVLCTGAKEFWLQSVENGAWRYAVEVYQDKAEKIAGARGYKLLFQPPETRTQDGFTQKKFSHESVRLSEALDVKHPPFEPYHMNGLYGQEMLRCFIGLLG